MRRSWSAVVFILALALPGAVRAETPLAKAQTAWWTAQGKPKRVRFSALEQQQLRRMSRIGPLSVDTFSRRVSVSKPDGKGGRWVYALENRHGDATASRVHFGSLNEPLQIYSERAFSAGDTPQVFKTLTWRKGEKPLPERFREALGGSGAGRRDIVSIHHVYAGGKRVGTGIAVTPGGRDFAEPGIVDGAFARVPRRKTPAEQRMSDLYRAHVTTPLRAVQRYDFPSHEAWQRARNQVIESGGRRVARTLGITPAALQDAMQRIISR